MRIELNPENTEKALKAVGELHAKGVDTTITDLVNALVSAVDFVQITQEVKLEFKGSLVPTKKKIIVTHRKTGSFVTRW